ncbi:hypothetical protein [Streptomyces chartreusis]
MVLTPNYSGNRPWDTTMFRVFGASQLTDEEVAQFSELWNHGLSPA